MTKEPRGETAERVADELEIRNIVARLAHLADTASTEDLDDYLALLTEDATWAVLSNASLPSQERRGHAEIRAAAAARRAEGRQGPGSAARHFISNHVVVFEAIDTARSRCYFQVFADTLSDRPYCRAVGEYHDTFVRTPEGWKMKRREIIAG